jgi:hypothetical protein
MMDLQGIRIGACFHSKQNAARADFGFVLFDARVRNAPIHECRHEAECYTSRCGSCQCQGLVSEAAMLNCSATP